MVARLRLAALFFFLLPLLLQGCGSTSEEAESLREQPAAAIDLFLSTATGETELVADGTSTLPIRLAVTDAAGTGIPNVAVTFATTAGSLSLPSATASRRQAETRQAQSGDALTVLTDASGVAEVLLTAPTTIGTATVTADALGFRTSLTVTFVAGPPVALTPKVTPQTPKRGETATLEALVTDAFGNPVANQAVTFSLESSESGGSLQAGGTATTEITAVTDTQGKASVTYLAGAQPGTDTVRITVSASLTATVAIQVDVEVALESEVASISLVAGADTLVADGSSAVTLRATVSNAAGEGLPGVVVTFTTTAGTLSPASALTDASGVASVSLIAATNIGTATVIASAAGFLASVTVQFVAGAPATIVLTATPSTPALGEAVVVQATVTDAQGNPTPGETLTFALVVNASGGSLEALSGVTDANGRVAVTYTAGLTPGTDTVQAEATNGVTGAVSITVQESITVPEVASISLVAGTDTLVADGVSATVIRATVRNAAGEGIPGITVTFTTTAGTLSPASALTDADGVASVSLIAATNIGTATVIASAAGFLASVTVQFVAGAPATIALTATPATVLVGGTVVVQATVTDAQGNPVPGETLTFALVVNASGGSLEALSGVTDANGRVAVTYTAGLTPGTDTVQAEATNGVTGAVSITVEVAAVPASLELLVSSPQMDSDGSETVTLTALVRDANNNFVAGVAVAFAADSGGITVVSGTTDASGAATAALSTAGDPSNRTITVTATAGGLSATNTVQVSGTTLSISGASALVLGQTTTLSLLLRDSGGTGIAGRTIALSSTLGNALSATEVTTDFNGAATVTVTATVADTDTIQASALGATATFILTVSPDNFVFTAPAAGAEIPLNTPQTLIVHWEKDGIPQEGQTINFAATRGVLSATSAVTDANGDAQVTIQANNAGPAVITATAASGGPSSQLTVEFIATQPASLILQASPTTLGVNPEGSTDQQSVITAVVRDPQGNLVKNQTVLFTLEDVTGGSIFPASAVTDSFGRASTVYTAGAVPSAQDGVIIDAVVEGTVGCNPADPLPAGPCDRVTLTVAQESLFVTLGTGNTVLLPSDTQYAFPYSVLVTDANGNPVAGATVELNLFPTRYQKGVYVPVFDEDGNFVVWAKQLSIDPASGFPDDTDQACNNEDGNRNGILDAGEDVNNNGFLEPGNVATVPVSLTTDETGFAFFNVTYAKEFTWVEVALEARATVAGSEGSDMAIFFLPGAASDFDDEDVAPPGAVSPYGVAITCACDERVDPTCLIPVSISPSSATLSAGGGTVTFTVSGGTRTTYTVTTTAGTLINLDTGESGTTITVAFGQSFVLTTTPDQDGQTITVTVTDDLSGQTAQATVTQGS
ncbi:MAG: hypothetical protein KatS3mg131_1872 [Candidatus Tectimicrobiota bacterium]|nr:MAG: hypothetical protein KatS3mg131_1872 [Candidatus Tectomicrobia bacterium]